jgi:hypothetical protein
LKSWSTKWLISDADLLKIRDHFGEKVAYYFAFLQNYLIWLSAPAVVGILVYLTHSNTLAIWFSLFMLLWAILFTEMWRRKESELALQWGVRNYSKHEKRRAEFKGEKIIKDRVTGEDTPYVSAKTLLGRRIASIPGVVAGAFLLSIIVGFVFVLQLFLHEYYNGPFRQFLVRSFRHTGLSVLTVSKALHSNYWLCYLYSYHDRFLQQVGQSTHELGNAQDGCILGIQLYPKDLYCQLLSWLSLIGKSKSNGAISL